MKENLVRDYMSAINFKTDDWSLSKIKEDLRKFLGEEPAIVVFTDTNDKFKKIEFLVGEQIL